MNRKNKTLIAAGVLALLAAAVFLPTGAEYFARRNGPFEESVLAAFGVSAQDIYNVQITFYGEGEFDAESPEDFAPVLDYLLSLNASSVFPQSAVDMAVSDRIVFLDFPGGSLSVHLLNNRRFAVWGDGGEGAGHHVYQTDSDIDLDVFRCQFNHYF